MQHKEVIDVALLQDLSKLKQATNSISFDTLSELPGEKNNFLIIFNLKIQHMSTQITTVIDKFERMTCCGINSKVSFL
jgi:hypothetical protein